MTPSAHKIVHRFLGGSLVASPATSFQGKDGRMVDLPDRLVLRSDGDEMPLSVQAFDAIRDVTQETAPELIEFLEKMRKPVKDDA